MLLEGFVQLVGMESKTLNNLVTQIKNILNLKGYQNCMIGSKLTAIFPNGWILPIGIGTIGTIIDHIKIC